LFGNQGHDSTANTLTWFTRFLSSFPTVQTTLRTALQKAFPGPALPSATEILTADIPYLDATCEETVRLSGTAKANLRQALVDTQILGCPIPKGAEIFMNFHVNRPQVGVEEGKRSETSRAAEEKRQGGGFEGVAGRDLGRFEPGRWIVVDEATGRERFDAYALPSLAFGGGFRGCFGEFFSVVFIFGTTSSCMRSLTRAGFMLQDANSP
jgi:hypothetical protein